MSGIKGEATPRILAEHDRRPHAKPAELAQALGLTRNQIIGVLHRHRPDWSQRGRDRRNWAQRQGEATGGCRYMIDNGQGSHDPNARFCDAPVLRGKSYCAPHHARCTVPPEPLKAAPWPIFRRGRAA